MVPNPEPFSVARMRSSMHVFAIGKVVAGVTGIAWLLLLVRVLEVEQYGGYIVLLALLEVVQLLSNVGVFAFAQRYVTEARLQHNLALLARLVWMSVAYRILTLAAAASLIAVASVPLSRVLGQPRLADALALYGLVLVFEGTARYMELVFESLLEQGWAQFCAVLRNGLRLGVVLAVWVSYGATDLMGVIQIEAVTSAAGLMLALVVMQRYLAHATHGSALHGNRPPDSFALRRLAPFALPLYVAQCLTTLYSADAMKLIVSRLLGVVEAATFGFAHAVSLVLQRYLPATLLIGLVRPMLVARRIGSGSDAELVAVGNLVLKLNLLLLLPAAALFAVAGADFASLASGGKYADSGLMLFLLTLLLVFVGLHMVLSMLAAAVEDRRAVLTGTLVSMPGVVVGALLARELGPVAMVVGLWLSELVWCSFTLAVLRRAGFWFRIDWPAWGRLALAGVVAGAAASVVLATGELTRGGRLSLAAGSIAVVYTVACVLLRPFSAPERAWLARLMPVSLRRWIEAR